MPGKRTGLLLNEAQKDKGKQLKALKDERRAALDGRHRYLISVIAEVISLGEMDVEEAIISDDQVCKI